MIERGSRFPPGLLLVFAVVVLAKGLVWTVVLPPWYGPDEPQHFDYVESLAVSGHPPRYAITRADGLDHPPEVACSQHNVGFRDSGAFAAQPPWLSDPSPCAVPAGPAARRAPHDTDAAAAYSPFYYVLALPFWEAAAGARVETRLQAVRLVSVLLGVLGALATLLAGWHAFGRRTAPAIAAGSVFAFQPMAAQQFAIFNNDALVVALAAVFFWRGFRAWAGGGLDWRAGVELGVITGLAYLAKPQGAYLAAPFLLFAILTWWRRRGSVVGAAATVAAFALPAAALAVLTQLIDLVDNGSLFSQASVGGGGRGSIHGYLAAVAVRDFEYLRWLWVTSAWGHFAWLDAVLPTIALVVIAIVGTVAGLAALSTPLRRPELAAAAVALAAFLLLAGLVQATELLYYRAHSQFVLQGRGFLVALPAGALVLTGGFMALAPRGRQAVAARVLTGAMVALGLLATGVLAEAFYG